MLLIVGTFRIDPALLDAARPAMAAMVAASRDEPGCLGYHYARDLLDPGLVHVVERWRDRAALAGHFSSPHLLEWRGSWQRLGIHDRNLRCYEGDGETI